MMYTYMQKSVIIIGAGVGGLATACILGEAGYNVTIYEKNSKPGGVAGTFKAKGYQFETGPSWYLMPEVFEQFFSLLGEDVHELLDLKKLAPSYRVFFKDTLYGAVDIYGDYKQDSKTFASIEPGVRQSLPAYLDRAAFQYSVAMDQFLYRNYNSTFDFLSPKIIRQARQLNAFTSMQKHVENYFSTPELQKIMLWPLVFLGANPQHSPALYSLVNHVDLQQGVFYPKGGMYTIVEVLVRLAKARGVKIVCNKSVKKIRVRNRVARGVILEDGTRMSADIVVSNTDIAHSELSLLNPEHRSYSRHYFKKRVLAPSVLMIHLGIKKRYRNLQHHNLIFSQAWDDNFKALFDKKKWPSDPSFYVSNPSKSDRSLAPRGKDTVSIVVPLPATLRYTDKELQTYADWIISTVEQTMHLKDFQQNIDYKKLVSAKDFQEQFNSYQGSALGIGHTLRQTAAFRPSNVSRKVHHLYYVGANTTPGIGLPMCLISAQLVYKRIVGKTDTQPLSSLKP